MKHLISGVILPALMLLVLWSPASGQDYDDVLGQTNNTITTAVPFLMIAPDARAGALGDAGVSSAPDANSMHWNPAKYAFVEQDMGFALSYTPWLRALINDINLSYLSGFKRIDELQTVAFSLVYFSLGEVNFTDDQGEFLFPVKPNEFAVSVAYARKLGDNISGAVSLRYINSNLTQGEMIGSMPTKPGQSLAADVSAYYTRELNWENTPARFNAGINISNIGNKISYTDEINADFIPINLRLGPSLTFDLDDFNQLSVMVDINKLLVPTTPIYAVDEEGNAIYNDDGSRAIYKGKDPNRGIVAGMFGSFSDAPGGFSEELNELTYSAGIEYWYDKQFALRGGYFHEHSTKGNRKYFTLGVGLKYNVLGIDFAYLVPVAQRSPLENVLRISLVLDLDAVRTQ